jgi:hypothetical protein
MLVDDPVLAYIRSLAVMATVGGYLKFMYA